MVKKFCPAISLLILIAGACFLPAENAHALTAEEYFADGNRLFRDDLYWAALLRYRQAAEEGMDTTVLHYNMGVAHYRAGQHIRARDELNRALGDPSLRVAAQYNLGLNAYELGDLDEALRWFRLARDQNQSETIQDYAVVAISRIRDELAVPDEFEVRVAEQEKKREFTDLQVNIRVGYGTDDNIFRSPDRPYTDRADPARPVVIAEAQEGAYVPVHVSAKYLINSLKFEGFYVAYRLNGRYYVDEEFENGNEYKHELSFGSEYHRESEDRKRSVVSAFTVAQHDQVYYDHDDGAVRELNGIDIGDRMNYLRYGPQFKFRQSFKRLALGADFKGQLWNYNEQATVPEYDHEFFSLKLHGQYKFTNSSLLRVTAEGYSRRFGDRPAFELDGTQPAGNPDIRYDYYSLKLTARQRFFRDFWLGFDVARTERVDQYLGYNDYSRDSVSAEVHWTPGDRFRVEARGTYNLYDYPNAFAFHDATGARKTQESAWATVSASYRLRWGLSLFAKAQYRETVSNDTRIQFERNQYVIGVRWEQ